MAATYTDNGTNTPNGSHLEFTYTFPVIVSTDVKVALNGVTQATTKYTVSTSPAKITFNNTSVDSTVQESTGAPKTGVTVRVYRETAVGKNTGDEDPKAVFAAGSSVRAADLNSNFEQVLFAAHEQQDKLILAENINTGAITSAKILDDTIVNADVNTSAAIAGTKVSPNFGSQAVVTTGTLAAGATTVTGNITVSGTVDGRDIATDGSKLDGIEAGATGNQTNAEIRAAVEAATDSNVFTDADHSKLDAIEASATADQTAAEIRTLVESASDSNVFTDADHSKLDAIEASADVTDATNVNAAGAVMNSDTTTASMQFVVDEDNFASDSATKVPTQQSTKAYIASYGTSTHQPLDNELTTLAGMQSGTASILASGTALTSTTAELNLLDGKSIVTSVSGSSTDVQLPTAKAVNDQIVALMQAAGGYYPIADEVSFPNANPDPNNDAGTIVSIADAGGVVVNGSGVSTTGRTLGGATVTINGIDSSLYNSTIAAGKGMLVQTTSTLNTYTYHRLVVDEAGVANAQTLVSDFNQRYRVGSSNPTSSLDDGDLFFNTSSDKMLVYNATSSAWEEVQSVGNYYINTISSYSGTGGNSASFNGSAYRFVLSNPGANAEQHLVSVNGVIQKPNSGTSQPGEGFAIDGSSIIFSAAPASGSDFFIITIGASVNIGTPSNNTVSTAIIQNGAVTTDKLASDAVTGAKIADDAINSEHYTDGSIDTAHIADLNITTGKIAADAITGAKIADDAVGSEHIEVLDAALQFGDSVKAQFGAGTDFELYHDGTDNVILSKGASCDLLTYVANGELAVKAVANGTVEIYYDNSKKFETTSDGAKVTGDFTATGNGGGADFFWDSSANQLTLTDSRKIRFGDSGDLEIYHDGTDSFLANTTGSLTIKNTGNINLYTNNNEDAVVCTANGAVDLYHNGTKKFSTQSGGAQVHGSFYLDDNHNIQLNDTNKIVCGAGSDLKIYHDGSNSYIDDSGTGNLLIRASTLSVECTPGGGEKMIEATTNGAVDLYYDNSKRFETTNLGAQITGELSLTTHLKLLDDQKVVCGAGEDLLIFHDGTNSRINNTTGKLIIKDDLIEFVRQADDSVSFKVDEGGATELYHNHNQKLYTYTEGVKVNGYIKAVFNVSDSHWGDNTNNWHHLHNEQSGNHIAVFENSADSGPYGNFMYLSDGSPDDNSYSFYQFSDSTAARCYIYSDGDLWNHDNSYTGSDETLKENIVDATPKLEDLKKLKVRNFNWKAEYFPNKSKKKQLGFIAQEVEQVFPSLVSEHDISPGSHTTPGHTPVMKKAIKQAWDPIIIKAMQELIEKVETLETKVAALEAK